jgi:glycosyltransferase involved in cell wall biosynthesis
MIVHQFLPTFEYGAVGNHSSLARKILQEAGHTSEIYAAEIRPSIVCEGAIPLGQYRGGADVIVYQLAIGSVAADAALARTEPLVVNSHNMTPLRYLVGWDHIGSHGVAWGLVQLKELAARASLGLAVSHFNEAELIEAGFSNTAVAPFLIDLRTLEIEPDPAVKAAAGTTWLFVGRLAANKAQHDLVKAFAAYRQFHDADAQLVLVGGGTDGKYGKTLARFVHGLGLDDAVTITGQVTDETLAAYYEIADVFVSASEHEGFCVPLLEAMHHRVPIVAYGAAAVPETLGNAGLLLHEKDPCTIAAAAYRVVSDSALQRQLVESGARRVPGFDVTRTGPVFIDAVLSAAR